MKRIPLFLIALTLALMIGACAARADAPDAAPLSLGEMATADITTADGLAYFSFCPETSGLYTWSATSYYYTIGYLYDADMNLLDSKDGTGFKLTYDLSAGATYYFGARYGSSTATGQFPVKLDVYRGLTRAVAVQPSITIVPEECVTMEVEAETTDGGITYQWYAREYYKLYGTLTWNIVPIDGANSSSYTSGPVIGYRQGAFRRFTNGFYCDVSDEYGNTQRVQFDITVDNNLSAGGIYYHDVTVSPVESAVMQVTASCSVGGLSYQWYAGRLDLDSATLIEGAVSDSFKTDLLTNPSYFDDESVDGYGNTKRTGRFECVVSDEYGDSATASFIVTIDNSLTVSAVNERITVLPTATPTMQIAATCAYGGLSYQWYGADDQPIEGATSSAYTSGPITAYTPFYCIVSDEYGSRKKVWVYISVNNNQMTAYADESEIYAAPNEPAAMRVIASCAVGGLTYEWHHTGYDDDGVYYDNIIDGATSDTYTVGAVSGYASFYCLVSDEYDHQRTIHFHIYLDNQLVAEPVNDFVYIPVGETATLEVEASCAHGELHYEWMYCLEVDGGTPTYTIEGANESSCSTHAITYNTRFICRVTDDYGNSESLWFYVRIDSGLSARAANDGRVSVAPGECAVLRVIASCDSGSLSYQWGRWSSGIIDGATAEAFTTGPITEAIDYYCRVSDDYGNRTYVSIYITIDNRLVAEPVGVSEFTILPGETVNLNLEVNASCALGELTYRWYESGYDEDGDSYYRRISGADTGVYACDGITRTTCIVCEVNDDYGNNESIRFNITCENGLKAVESQTIYVAQGEDAVLTAEAVCDCDDLFYIWYNVDEDDENMGYKGESTYTLTGVEYSDDSIYCQVIDMYGNYAYCHFEVYVENDISAEAEVTVNGLSVEYDGSPITVSAGDDVAITLAGTCEQGEIDYFWDDYEDNFSEGDTFTFTDIQSESYINGFVRDAFGNEVVFFFDFVIENGLTVSPVGDTFLSVSEGEEVTLAVEASADIGDISFRWEKDYTEMDENGPSVTFNASTGGMYTCEATDIYGNTMRTNFVINVGSPQVLIPDEEVFLTLKGGGSACLAFTPGESGDYNIFSSGSNDPIVYLYDGDGRQIGMNDDSGDNYNFSLTAYLNAGETYLYIVRYADAYGSHSFSVMLTRRQADGDVISSGTYVLRSGQTGRLPYSGEHIVSVTSDNSSVVSASGLTITAVRAGTANLTLEWVDGFTATVEIVVKAESALTLPASLSQIESEAFASDRSVRFAELGRGVQRIGPFAFSESGLWQICIPSSDTQIAASAFYGITPTILCKEGSAAAEYAMNHGNPFLYID